MQKCKNIKNTTIQKNTWVPAINTKMQKRAKHKKSKNCKTAKNRRKGPCASYFPQNFQMIYRDSTKNKIKIWGVCYFALRTSFSIFHISNPFSMFHNSNLFLCFFTTKTISLFFLFLGNYFTGGQYACP